MSIKNSHIIHKLIKNESYPFCSDIIYKYLCIGCVNPTPEKSSHSWKNVTCKNCLARRK